MLAFFQGLYGGLAAWVLHVMVAELGWMALGMLSFKASQLWFDLLWLTCWIYALPLGKQLKAHRPQMTLGVWVGTSLWSIGALFLALWGYFS